MTKKITYGRGIFKGVNFNLYGYDDLEFEYSKKEILDAFKGFIESSLKAKLKAIGLQYLGLEYYSPMAYNYQGDNIDLVISAKINKPLLKEAILFNKDRINDALNKNKSYDGYMAITVYDVAEELTKLKDADYEPDIIVLSELLDLDCSEFIIHDYFIHYEVV